MSNYGSLRVAVVQLTADCLQCPVTSEEVRVPSAVSALSAEQLRIFPEAGKLQFDQIVYRGSALVNWVAKPFVI